MEQIAEVKKTKLFEGVTPYHWFVVLVASAGWLFDCMDQRLFVMSRQAALTDLMGVEAAQSAIDEMVGWATTAMILGWATGGIIFGMMSDRVGRVRTMVLTLFIYAGFTGLCALAKGWGDFLFYRFLVGLGVGGMFGAATSLVAESVPSRVRALALGTLQALSAFGNILGAYIAYHIKPSEAEYIFGLAGWQVLFTIGVLPAFLVIPIVFILKEPDSWIKAKAESAKGEGHKSVGSFSDLFKNKRWRTNTIVGLCLGVSGMVGLWGIGFYSPELITDALSDNPIEENYILKPTELVQTFNDSDNQGAVYIKGLLSQSLQQQIVELKDAEPSEAIQKNIIADLNKVVFGKAIYSAEVFPDPSVISKDVERFVEHGTKSEAQLAKFNRLIIDYVLGDKIYSLRQYSAETRAIGMGFFDIGAFFGMFAFTFIASFFSRRLAFLLTFIMCLFVTIFVFSSLDNAVDAYWMLPLMGFAQLAVFGGYSIYFPELYPTRLRGTGVGFCYNTVRYLLAPFPALMMMMTSVFFNMGFSQPIRVAAIIMSFIYIIGMVALIWAPETKDQPLPED